MYIGLDVGGTFVKAARIGTDGKMVDHRHIPVARDSIAALLDQLENTIGELLTGDTVAVGIGVPGIIDRSGRVRTAPNLSVLDGQAVGAELRRRACLITFLENDANAAALAECWLGAGGGAEDCCSLPWAPESAVVS
jgi:predicted NBD/HSP70 family sugar kinase